MLSITSFRRCWWAVAAVVIACQSPARAEAGCGGHSGSPHALLEVEPPPAAGPRPTAPQPPGRPTPCQGPNCSSAPRQKGLPVPTAAAPPVQVKDQVRCFCGDAPDRPSHAFERDSHSPKPVRRATSIFHPPRIG